MANILERDGLTIDLLKRLSYKSELGINLKKNLHYFDKDSLIDELKRITSRNLDYLQDNTKIDN